MRRFHFILVLAASLTLAGCLKFEMSFVADNSGKFIFVHPATNLEEFKRRAASSVVTIEESSLKDGKATLHAKFTDVTKLNTAEVLRDVVITVEKDDKGQSKFIARLNNSFAKKTPESVLKSIIDKAEKEAKIDVTFPGEIVETNATSKDGKHATWVVPTKDLVYSPLIRFEATYK